MTVLPDRCVRNHPLVGDNVLWIKGKWRQCRECNRIRYQAYQERRRLGLPKQDNAGKAPRIRRQITIAVPSCERGHSLTPTNIQIHHNGNQQCRICAREDYIAWAETHSAY